MQHYSPLFLKLANQSGLSSGLSFEFPLVQSSRSVSVDVIRDDSKSDLRNSCAGAMSSSRYTRLVELISISKNGSKQTQGGIL